jgi:hypothetical protein
MARGLENQRIANLSVEKCIVGISSESVEERFIKTYRVSTGIVHNLTMTESNP